MPHDEEPGPTRRAVTYARQSKERGDKSAASPEGQRRATRAHVEAQGWEHFEHFADLGRSGWDPKADRPGLDGALAALEAGHADVIVVHRLDRLSRAGVVEAVALVRRIQKAGAVFVSVKEPFFDLTDEMGLAVFGIFAALAKQESDNISTRTLAAKAVLRGVGSHMSGRPPYGHAAVKVMRDGLTVRDLIADPVEAPVVRDVVGRVLRNESVVSLARDLNARGITTRSGSAWTTSTLGRLLRSPTLAGYMPAHREGRNTAAPRDSRGRVMIATGDDGRPMQPWEPLVTPSDWHRLQDVLDARPAVRGTAREASLLGGAFLRCGECGGPMAADRRPLRPDGTSGSAYRCAWHRSGKKRDVCPGVSVNMDGTDEFVIGAVFRRLAALDPENPDDLAILADAAERFTATRETDGALTTERSTLAATVESARAALERLDDDRAEGIFDGALGGERYARQVRAYTKQYESASTALASLPEPTVDLGPLLDLASAADEPGAGPLAPGAPWAKWEIEEWREFLGLFLERVEARKGVRRGGAGRGPIFDGAERLTLVWRE